MKFNPGNNFNYLDRIKPQGYSITLHSDDDNLVLTLISGWEDKLNIKYSEDILVIEIIYQNPLRLDTKVLNNNSREYAESLEGLIEEFIQDTNKLN